MLAHLASLGPAGYCLRRGWIAQSTYDAVNLPGWAYRRYLFWWEMLAWKHEGVVIPPPAEPSSKDFDPFLDVVR